MNLWTDSERKWALEPESKPESEGIHLHHNDMSKQVNYTATPIDTNYHPPRGQSVEFYFNKWISWLIRDENEL